MPLIPDFVVENLYQKMKQDCKTVAKIDISEIDCAEMATKFPNIPVVCLYSKRDKLVTSSDSMAIFGKLKTNYKLFVDCKVNMMKLDLKKLLKEFFYF